MAQRAMTNKGFSMIELMVAMVIIIVSMFAAMSATITSVRANANNEMRTVGSRVMSQTAEALLSMSFADPNLANGSHSRIPNDAAQTQLGLPNTVQVVKGASQNFSIQWNVSTLTPKASMQIDITVSYTFRNNAVANKLTLFKHATL